MSLFLAEVAARYPLETIVLAVDGAPWHKGKELTIPENIHLLFLPPYSPELNPVEQLWKGMRLRWFANCLFETLSKMEDKLEEALKWVENTHSWVKSFSLYHWIDYALTN